MKISIDPKTSLPRFRLERKDLEDARKIQEMMETEGWKILKDYLEVARESLIESGKDDIYSRAKRDLADIRFAVIKGFDEAFSIPQRIVLRAEKFIEEERKAQKEEEGGQYDDEQ